MDLTKTLHISAAGMKVQGARLKVIAENIANAQSLSPVPGGDPYRRKVVSFQNVLDRSLGVETVRVSNIDSTAPTSARNMTRATPPPTRTATCPIPTSTRWSR